METINFTPIEVEALLKFLMDYIDSTTLSKYGEILPRHLFLAFIKLLKAKEQWDESMAYTE